MGNSGDSGVGQRRPDPAVPGPGERRDVSGPVNARSSRLACKLGNRLLRASVTQDQVGADFAQILAKRLQAAEHEGGSAGRNESPPGQQPVVEDEAGEYPVGPGRLGKGRKVMGPESPSEPHDRG